MKTVFILNPQTDKKEQAIIMQEIKKNYQGQKIIIEKTQSSKHARFIAQKYALKDEEDIHLFICGGDGTVHHVINGLAGAEHIKVSVLPIGTGNDFVKYFEEYKREDFLDLSKYKNGYEMKCDLLKLDGEYAMNTISFGFDVKVAQFVNDYRKVSPFRGVTAYYLGVLKNIMGSLSDRYQIQIDDNKLPEALYSFVVCTNGRFYGGGYKPCPDALINDGIMDVCLVNDIKKTDLLKKAKLYEKGEHIHYPDLATLYRANTFHIDTNNQEIIACMDGEMKIVKNPTIEIESNQICLLLPKK